MATISANGDVAIGSMVAEAFERLGKEGTITVAEGKTMEHELEVVEGMNFDGGLISPSLVSDEKAQKCCQHALRLTSQNLSGGRRC